MKGKPVTTPITFTGHSLGGAVAGLMAMNTLSSDFSKMVNVFTYGQPAYVSEAYINAFNQKRKLNDSVDFN